MTGGQFIVTELLRDGAVVVGGAARFEWSAELRSMPRRPWTIGTAVRNKRTDYPGGDEPAHQVLGPNSKDQVLEGTWDDRWNGAGYARATRLAFDTMVRRANLVRIEYSGIAFVGLITEAEYPLDYDSRIGYRFTLSPQVAEEADPLRPASNATRAMSASALTDSLSTDVDRVRELRALAPTAALSGTVASDVGGLLDDLEAAFADLDAALNQRIVQPAEEAKLDVLRVGALFASMRNVVGTALNTLITLRADTELGYQTASDVLNFEAWCRELGFQLRLLSLHASDASDEVASRAEADVRCFYRPFQGEHLYSISRRFYGSTSQWRMIAQRNGLVSPTLSGDELLVIPAAGAVTDRDGVGASAASGSTLNGANGSGRGTGTDSGGTTANGAGGIGEGG
jgi:hypothetical protein